MVRSRPISTVDSQAPPDLIRTILDGSYRLPETGGVFHCPIKSLCIEPNLSGQERDLISKLGLNGQLALVCDPNTFDALGQRLSKALPHADLVVLKAPLANEAQASDLMDKTRHADSLIAVGSGSLNDLCKYVSHRRRQPYAVFPTAPSMNGYTTSTASMTCGGEKLSLPATPPLGVFFDLTILAKAPRRMIRAGVGDSLCRGTVEVDWFLSHKLRDTPFTAAPFLLQTRAEADLLERISHLQDEDLDAMRSLVELLTLGGLGMLIIGSSQSGSQGEHLISHYIDMFHRPHPGTLHGEQVGLSTWTMARLQRNMLDRVTPPMLGRTIIDEASMRARYGKLSSACLEVLHKKVLTGRKLDLMNEKLAAIWGSLRSDLSAKLGSLDGLMAAFNATGVALDAETCGIDPSFYGVAVGHARELRDRFTMLDLAADANHLERFIDDHL